MRIIDRVLDAPEIEVLTDSTGRRHFVDGPSSKADAIRDCTLRYALDPEASRQCGDLFLKGETLPRLDDPLVRMPATRFWMEVFADNCPRAGVLQSGRVALLVETDDTARKGIITLFSEQSSGDIRLFPGVVEFDLDSELIKPPGCSNVCKMRHRDLDRISPVLRHALLHLNEDWDPFAKACIDRTYGEYISFIAESLWFTLPLVLAFAAMLNSGTVLDKRLTDLTRLNAARMKRGRRPLLEHTEVSLRLDAKSQPGEQRRAGGGRESPRMHLVRGHPVHRASKTFWRASHFRGDAATPPVTRNVNVSWGPRGKISN